MRELSDAEWPVEVRRFERTAWRFEQQRIYPCDVHAGMLDDFLGGEFTPSGPDEWSAHIARQVAAGKEIVRVRVFEDPPTIYQRWLREDSAAVVAAGEVQLYITRA